MHRAALCLRYPSEISEFTAPRPMTRRPRSQVFVITGASDGIGAALARQLAARGHRLVLAAPGSDALDALNTDCWNLGAKAVAVPTDVTVESECQRLIERAIEAFSRIDVLINSAGVPMHVETDDNTDRAALDALWRVTFAGSRDCSRFALPFLPALPGKPAGQIVCTGVSGDAERCADAGAQDNLLESLATDVAEHGVALTVVYPAARPIAGVQQHGGASEPASDPPLPGAEDATFVDVCASEILDAITARRPELVVTGKRGLGRWLRRLAPA